MLGCCSLSWPRHQYVGSMITFRKASPLSIFPIWQLLVCVHESVVAVNWLPLLGKAYHFALRGIEGHQPVSFPILQSVQVLLYLFLIFWRSDDAVQEAVICKKATGGGYMAWQVVDISQKEERAENRSLLYTRSD